MFTSDVSARGVDYPDVSLVVQVCTLLVLVRIYATSLCLPPLQSLAKVMGSVMIFFDVRACGHDLLPCGLWVV